MKLLAPDGKVVLLSDPAELPSLLKQGFKEVGEDYEPSAIDTAAETYNAGQLGVLQGLTGGLYGGALGFDKGAAHEAKALAEEHPVAHGAGEFGGLFASPLGEVGGALEGAVGATTTAGRLGAKLLGGAGVGSLFGAGSTVSDAALGDQQLNAEKLIAGMGMGALLGVAGAGVGAAVEEGAKGLIPKLGKSLGESDGLLSEFASNRALKAAGLMKSDLRYLGEGKAQRVGKMMLERGHLGQGLEAPSAQGILDSVQRDKEATGKAIGDIYDQLEKSGAQPNYPALQEQLAAFEQSLSPLQRKAAQPAIDEASKALHEYAGLGFQDGAAVQLREPAGFSALKELKNDLQSKAKWSNNLADQFGGDLKRQLSGVVRDALDQQILPHLGADVGQQFVKSRELYGLLSDAERVAEHGVEKLGGNASFGLRDTGLGAAGLLLHGNPITGLGAALASKFMRERGQGVIARLAHSIGNGKALSVTAASFQKAAQALGPRLGRYAPPILSGSPAESLATHMVLAQVDPEYAKLAEANGLRPETAPEQQAHLTKAHSLASMAATLQGHDEEIDKLIEGVVKGSGSRPKSPLGKQDFGAQRMRRDAPAAHEKRLEEIRALHTNPQALIDRVTAKTGNLANVAPGISAHVAALAQRAVDHLAKQGEHPLKAGPLAPSWKHSDAERYEFAQHLEAVQEPLSVLRHAAHGTLTPARLQALQSVYPTLARDISDRVVNRLISGPSVPYKQRLMLAMLSGVDPDGTLKSLAANQAAIRASKTPTQPPPESENKVTLADRMSENKEQQQEV